ncbi:MAG: APC family permease, partial [Catenulispora sp.]|nr:APC family permease [Catenulispora sp.]
VYQVSGGMPVLAYLVGLIALLFTAASYSQMVKAFPLAGSVYNYAGRGLGAPFGFITGWAILLDYLLVPGLLYLVASLAMNASVPAIPFWGWLLIFVGGNTIINLRGIKMTANFTKIMIVGELIILAIYLGVGIYAISQGKGHFSLKPLFDSAGFSWSIVGAAVSVAVLSFLGFVGIAMLVEESKGGPTDVAKAMRWALGLAGLLFIAQVWVAAALVPDSAGLIANGDPNGTAFYDTAQVAGGHWLYQTTSIATAIAWGLADTLVAQVAVSRLLYAMGRDKQLPAFLAKVSPRRAVPTNAILLVAALSLALVLFVNYYWDNGLARISSMINMGAITAFVILHLTVIWHYVVKKRSGNLWGHLLAPIVGAAILIFVAYNADTSAKWVAGIWIAAGLVILGGLYAVGNKPKFEAHPLETTSAPAPEGASA